MFLIFNLGGLNMKKYIVTFTEDDRGTLSALTSIGNKKKFKITILMLFRLKDKLNGHLHKIDK